MKASKSDKYELFRKVWEKVMKTSPLLKAFLLQALPNDSDFQDKTSSSLNDKSFLSHIFFIPSHNLMLLSHFLKIIAYSLQPYIPPPFSIIHAQSLFSLPLSLSLS